MEDFSYNFSLEMKIVELIKGDLLCPFLQDIK